MDRTLYARRNLVERWFGRLKTSRRVAIRYDKTVASFLGFVDIACSRLWNRRFVNTAKVGGRISCGAALLRNACWGFTS